MLYTLTPPPSPFFSIEEKLKKQYPTFLTHKNNNLFLLYCVEGLISYLTMLPQDQTIQPRSIKQRLLRCLRRSTFSLTSNSPLSVNGEGQEEITEQVTRRPSTLPASTSFCSSTSAMPPIVTTTTSCRNRSDSNISTQSNTDNILIDEGFHQSQQKLSLLSRASSGLLDEYESKIGKNEIRNSFY